MAIHERGKRFFRAFFSELPQQCVVIRSFHLAISVRRTGKTDNLFEFWQ
jgi:hypothetical protein